jgi:ribosomal protein L32
VEFVAPAERKVVTDEKSLKRAKAGADIYCAFCETRNPATQEACIQCGADLTEGKRRKAGGEVRQRKAEKMIACPSCDTENASSNHTCSECGAPLMGENVVTARAMPKSTGTEQAKNKLDSKKKNNWIVAIVIAVILCCIAGAIFFFSPSKSVTGTVDDVYWQTSIPLQEEGEVNYSNERGSPPSGAYDVSCHTESEEVCTEEMVDQGNGFAEVVKNCETHSEEYCSYSVMEWQTVETFTLDGHDYAPEYANPSLSSGQRLGNEDVTYTVTFSADSEMLDYSVDDLDEYRQFQIDSEWTLKMNRLGGIVSVER